MLGNPGYFCFESGSWALESGLQFKESGIPPAIGIWNPISSDRESGIQLNTFLMQKLSLFHELCIAADHVGPLLQRKVVVCDRAGFDEN